MGLVCKQIIIKGMYGNVFLNVILLSTWNWAQQKYQTYTAEDISFLTDPSWNQKILAIFFQTRPKISYSTSNTMKIYLLATLKNISKYFSRNKVITPEYSWVNLKNPTDYKI